MKTTRRNKPKKCPRCKEEFPAYTYALKGGRASYCDQCWRDYSRDRMREHRLRKFLGEQ